MSAKRYDLVVVGAGSAGAACALAAARYGLRVALLERQRFDKAGARWVNGVPGWCFDAAGLARPAAPEARGAGKHGRFHLVGGYGPRRLVIDDLDSYDVDMRRLVERLQREAATHGVEMIDEATVTAFNRGGVSTTSGELRTDLVVDASGWTGARLLPRQPLAVTDLCAAAQEVRRVSDPAAALAFFHENQAEPGDIICFSGVEGGYSILNLRLEGDEFSILTGSIPSDGRLSGQAMIRRFVREHPFIGERIFGGARVIPLAPANPCLVGGRVALLGDSGCQVFAAHGSGVGAGLVAARMLADAVAQDNSLWAYNVAWQRKLGGLFASSYLFARYSRTLSGADIGEMLESGAMSEASVRATMTQQLPRLGFGDLYGMGRAVTRIPRRLRGLVPVISASAGLQLHYRRYPEKRSDLPRWLAGLRRWLWLGGISRGDLDRHVPPITG
ncbi:MAG: FAD-dependent oxidoreductase [Myxococcales bacterium]|nr:FAD-dependent oxidoreductase [Myxococcales bacterium]